MRVLFVFLDGVGIGPADPAVNPFLSARLPTLVEALGGIPTQESPSSQGPMGSAFPLDACLGVEGRPQSGTGQTALLTGDNAARTFGRHFGPWTPTGLRPLLAARNVLVRAREAGAAVAFANAYPEGYLQRVPTRRMAAPPLAADAAGVLDRHHVQLAAGEAVASEIVNDGWRTHLGFQELPVISPEQAGINLAGIAARHDVTLYAHYRTDQAGHEATLAAATVALERVDRFLAGVMQGIAEDTVVLVASDHGNIEELTGMHTTNPVLGMLLSRGNTPDPAGLASIMDVPARILEWLGEDSSSSARTPQD